MPLVEIWTGSNFNHRFYKWQTTIQFCNCLQTRKHSSRMRTARFSRSRGDLPNFPTTPGCRPHLGRPTPPDADLPWILEYHPPDRQTTVKTLLCHVPCTFLGKMNFLSLIKMSVMCNPHVKSNLEASQIGYSWLKTAPSWFINTRHKKCQWQFFYRSRSFLASNYLFTPCE